MRFPPTFLCSSSLHTAPRSPTSTETPSSTSLRHQRDDDRHTDDGDVVAAVREQVGKLTHSSSARPPTSPHVRAAELLAELTPGDFKKKSFFVDSGAEAVENGVKVARKYTGRGGVRSAQAQLPRPHQPDRCDELQDRALRQRPGPARIQRLRRTQLVPLPRRTLGPQTLPAPVVPREARRRRRAHVPRRRAHPGRGRLHRSGRRLPACHPKSGAPRTASS